MLTIGARTRWWRLRRLTKAPGDSSDLDPYGVDISDGLDQRLDAVEAAIGDREGQRRLTPRPGVGVDTMRQQQPNHVGGVLQHGNGHRQPENRLLVDIGTALDQQFRRLDVATTHCQEEPRCSFLQLLDFGALIHSHFLATLVMTNDM